MREILSIHVGQCGNQIGEMFWELILQEHGLNKSGEPTKAISPAEEKAMNVFFEKVNDTKYVPRAIMVDLEPGVISRIEGGELSELFDHSNIIKKIPGAANNWARGFKVEGQKVIDQIMNVIDSNVETCKSLQGFLITHSIGGGSGSGLGALIIEQLRKAYPDKKIFTFSVAPSPLISDSAIEPYNAILTLNKLKDNADAVVLLDNDTLFLTPGLTIDSASFDFLVNPGDQLYVLAQLEAKSERGGIADAGSTLEVSFTGGDTSLLDAAIGSAVTVPAPASLWLLLPFVGFLLAGDRTRRGSPW